MKNYSFETSFRSLKDELCTFLRKNKITFELSGDKGFWYFSINCTPQNAQKINAFIDSVSIINIPA